MESVREFFTNGRLGKALLILTVVVAGLLSWRAVSAVNDNSGFKPAPIQTPAEQIADIETSVKQVEANPRMSEEDKQRLIAMLRSHEPGKTASAATAPQ
jgi:hypothetical protein